MKYTNHLFGAFEKRFNLAGKKWAEWMSKREVAVSSQSKKVYLLVFVLLMISILWLPLFYKNKSSVVDVGSINPPVSLDRNDYQHTIHRMNYLIDSIQVKSLRRSDSAGKQVFLNSDEIK